MNPDPKTRLSELFTAHAADTLTPEEHAELQTHLRSDAEARRWWFVHQDVEIGLRAHLAADGLTAPKARVNLQWLSWRPLTAAAAGIVLGMFFTSIVSGYVMSSQGGRMGIFSDGFESGAQPVVDGQQPSEPGHWGGDFTEVVGAQGAVRPADGGQMLRFIRADHAGNHLPQSFSSDVFRLIDLRPWKQELAAGTAVVRLSASFNGEITEQEGPFSCVLMLYALDAAFVRERQAGQFSGSIRERMLAHSSSTRLRLDSDPLSWQKAGNELRLPPDTDYLMIQVGMTHDSREPGQRRDAFSAHYADQVHVVLAHLPQIATP
jgi:hypothetical protein